jgi:hypothetical protein
MPPDIAELWRHTRLAVAPESYVLASLPPSRLADAAALIGAGGGSFAALLLERDEVSITVEASRWRSSALATQATATAGPYRAVTLAIDLALDVVGYLAPAVRALAEARVPIVPQCAFKKDHLLVRAEDLQTTLDVLETLIATHH